VLEQALEAYAKFFDHVRVEAHQGSPDPSLVFWIELRQLHHGA
jgi:hypothetical protein